ncbi:uncharacterized protein LOC108742118 isoform X1 [Agrilus planipennis]|uniref:Uncharacterized protein LOC108742118 isoform X1 n=1 Tax=Agrilus planipennis TaxID=224129 RepID=A0A1W4XIQ2_AGRPL|nr:uncharacterized protein LOC108742118 isoform X1 [Agrilus planipennis]
MYICAYNTMEDNVQPSIQEISNNSCNIRIVIDDFDSSKHPNNTEVPETGTTVSAVHQHQPTSINMQRSYNNRLSTNDSIRSILEEAERRKHEFWKLIEEHNALIQYLKRIEQLEHNNSLRKTAAIST